VETANHSRTASPKGRRRSFVCFQKTGRKGPEAVRKSLRRRNYKTGGNCRQKGRTTITDSQNAPTHQLNYFTDSWTPQGRITMRNKTNKRHHSKEDKRKLRKEEDAWTIPKLLRRKAGGY